MSIFKKEKGFTLIELLVVVAIIGILASIVLVSIIDARARGTDAAVKSNLHTTKLEAETLYLNNGSSYGGPFGPDTCPTYNDGTSNMFSQNKVIAESIAEAVKNGDGSSCYSSADFWAVAVGLRSKAGTSWCVDTQGVAKLEGLVSDAINPSTQLCN